MNAVDRMIKEHLSGVEFMQINTDAQQLANWMADHKIHIGLNLTKWLGAWANPEIWRKAAEENSDEIKRLLHDTDMVFIAAWMWGWTWTWAAPVIGQIAREMWILTVWVVTKPFSFEWKARFANAGDGIEKMKQSVDTLIVIPNDKIFNIVDKKTTFNQAFLMIDKVLMLGVQWIADLITKPGLINIDFADIKKIIANSGTAVLGIGYGEGENRAVEAARKAIDNPLLEARLTGAKKIIFAVTWWLNLTPIEVQEASRIVEEIIDPDAEMIWGMTIDEDYGDDDVKITIIATGFIGEEQEWPLKPSQRDLLGRKVSKWAGDDFVTRTLRGMWNGSSSNNNSNSNSPAQPQKSNDDGEIPAFMRRNLMK